MHCMNAHETEDVRLKQNGLFRQNFQKRVTQSESEMANDWSDAERTKPNLPVGDNCIAAGCAIDALEFNGGRGGSILQGTLGNGAKSLFTFDPINIIYWTKLLWMGNVFRSVCVLVRFTIMHCTQIETNFSATPFEIRRLHIYFLFFSPPLSTQLITLRKLIQKWVAAVRIPLSFEWQLFEHCVCVCSVKIDLIGLLQMPLDVHHTRMLQRRQERHTLTWNLIFHSSRDIVGWSFIFCFDAAALTHMHAFTIMKNEHKFNFFDKREREREMSSRLSLIWFWILSFAAPNVVNQWSCVCVCGCRCG